MIDDLKDYFQEKIGVELRNVYGNPAKLNTLAYKRVFETSQLDYFECWKYVININRYLKEIFYKYADEKISQLFLDCKFKLAEKIKKTFIEVYNDVKMFEKKEIKDTEPIARKLRYETSAFIPFKFFAHFLSGFEDGSKSFSIENLLLNAENEIKKTIEEYIQSNIVSEIIGCESKCPLCKAKCCLLSGEHQHQTNIHLFSAYGGCIFPGTKTPILTHCLEKKSIEMQWHDDTEEKAYPSLYDMIQNHHPSWGEHFPKVGEVERYVQFEHLEIAKRVWMNIRKPLIEKIKNEMVDEVPPGWEAYEKKEWSLTKEMLIEKSFGIMIVLLKKIRISFYKKNNFFF